MNLNFLNPSYLWLLPLMVLPVILHLLLKKHHTKLYFSDTRLLELALKNVKSGFVLRKYLLLIARMLLLAFIILLFARPVINYGGANQGKDKSLSVVILMDVSYSMNASLAGKTKLQLSVEKAKRIISMLSENDRIAVVAYSDIVEAATPGLSNDKNYILKTIESLKPSNRPTNIEPAINTALKFFGGDNESRKTIIILSDNARHGFKKESETAITNLTIVYIKQDWQDNYSFQSAKPSYNSQNNSWDIAVKIKAHTKAVTLPVTVSLYTDNIKIGSQNAVFADSKAEIYFNTVLDKDKTFMRCEITADSLVKDNNIYFVCEKKPKVNVWIVDGDPKFAGIGAESFYLRTVLPYAKVLTDEEAQNTIFTLPGVVVLANNAQEHQNVKEYAETGGGVMVFLGDKYATDNLEYFPVSVGSRLGKTQSVEWTALYHPLEINGSITQYEWKNVSIDEGYALQPKQNAQVLAKYSSGYPFIVEGRYGNGKVMVISTGADRDWGNFVAKPVFPAFIKEATDYLAFNDRQLKSTDLKIGDYYQRKTADSVSVVSPLGIKADSAKMQDYTVFGKLEESGFYSVYKNTEEIDKFAVNIDYNSDESNLKCASTTEIEELFKGLLIKELSNDNWEVQLRAVLSGKEVSRKLIILLLLLFAAEALLATKRML